MSNSILLAMAILTVAYTAVLVCLYLFAPFAYIQALYSLRLEKDWRSLWHLQTNLAKILIRDGYSPYRANEITAMFIGGTLKADPWEWAYFADFMANSKQQEMDEKL